MRINGERANVCANMSAHNVVKADINGKEKFDVVFGGAAQINVDTAVKYIKSGQKEIDDYVQTSLESAISSKQDVIEDLENIRTGANLGISSVQPADLDISLSQKQETLVSGNNIKTINNQSLLGFGNISISGGVDSVNGKTGDVVLTTSDLTNDSGYITGSSLATVATSGDYDDLTNTPTVYHPDLLSFQWSDHLLNNVSWLRADTFSWQDGTVYAAAYEHLTDDITGITPTTETIGSNTITVYVATDGHKIVLEDQAQTVQDIYDETGVAWYFILDTTNQRFKLPRTKFGLTGLRDSVGKYVPESLPNITGDFNTGDRRTHTSGSGAFYSSTTTNADRYSSQTSATTNECFGFDASRSSSTYQDNAPVQPPATQMYLYFYVGDYTQTAIEQTAGLNAELFNGKADNDLINVTNAGTSKAAGWAMPSDTADTLTVGASGSTYTAPANGYFYIKAQTTSDYGYAGIVNTFNSMQALQQLPFNSGINSFIPAKKGCIVQLNYANATIEKLRFIYAEGENV